MSKMICERIPTQIPAEKEFQRAHPLYSSRGAGAAGLEFSASLPKRQLTEGNVYNLNFNRFLHITSSFCLPSLPRLAHP